MLTTKRSHALRLRREIARAYPELKANENYQQLMSKLENVEQELLKRRDRYNDFAEKYNTFRNIVNATVPPRDYASRMGFAENVASRMGFENAPYFTLGAGDDVDNLTVFMTDSGEMLREMLRRGMLKKKELEEKRKRKTVLDAARGVARREE